MLCMGACHYSFVFYKWCVKYGGTEVLMMFTLQEIEDEDVVCCAAYEISPLGCVVNLYLAVASFV